MTIKYEKSINMCDFLFGVKHKDIIYISEIVFEALKDKEHNPDILKKLAIFDYDNTLNMKNQLNLDNEQFEKLMIVVEQVISPKTIANQSTFGTINDYGYHADGTKKYQV